MSGPAWDGVQEATGLLLAVQVGHRGQARQALDGLRALVATGGDLEDVVEGLPEKPPPVRDEDVEAMAELRSEGLTFAVIAERFRLSRQRVQQLLVERDGAACG